MNDPFDAMSYVLRSRNRFAILEAVADRPCERSALVVRTESSRVTVGRILRDFEERAWVTTDGREYVATVEGRALANAVRAALDELKGVERVAPLLPEFPLEDAVLPRGALAAASVTTPNAAQPLRPTQRLTELGANADVVRTYAVGITVEATEAHLELVRDAGQHLELLVPTTALEAARQTSAVREPLSALVRTDAVVAVCDPDPTFPFVARFDDHAVLAATTDNGTIAGIVEWETDEMAAWVDDRLDDHLAASDPLTPAEFPP
ncbi:helix-turn-helix transcriptional regulator [Halorubellus salinus]|uniref:helix-turn-helix transcriptional regulator n=1 Tax=Halorubellus salinus TaxID=755309 RepID=UPI001D089579|nr:hypothetical protein [Halorubellus salinus]